MAQKTNLSVFAVRCFLLRIGVFIGLYLIVQYWFLISIPAGINVDTTSIASTLVNTSLLQLSDSPAFFTLSAGHVAAGIYTALTNIIKFLKLGHLKDLP